MSFIRTSRHILHPDSGMSLPDCEVTPRGVTSQSGRLMPLSG